MKKCITEHYCVSLQQPLANYLVMLSVCKEDSIQITVGNISKSAYSVRKKWSRDFELGFALKLKDESGKD